MCQILDLTSRILNRLRRIDTREIGKLGGRFERIERGRNENWEEKRIKREIDFLIHSSCGGRHRLVIFILIYSLD